jgi:hypothetical protein
MAGDIGWKSAELHIEALIPGVLIIAEAHALAVSWLDYRVTTSAFMPASEFARAALFVAAGYSVGVVSSLVSRVLVDSISERGPRKVVFGAFAHQSLDKAIGDCQANDPRFVDDQQRELQERKWSKVASWNAVYRSLRRITRRVDDQQRELQERKWSEVASWNAVYRSALRRTTRRDEVDRRRSQGRFVRNLLVPAVGAPLILFPSPWSVLFAIASIPLLVFLYAYAEYVNFAEAYDISEGRPR